jgi:ATP-binding protein involved in chromosome partitioning
MASPDQALNQALAALEPLQDAGSGRSLLELQWIQQVRVQNNRVVFRLALPGYANAQRERIAADARGALLQLGGIDDVKRERAEAGPQAATESTVESASIERRQ